MLPEGVRLDGTVPPPEGHRPPVWCTHGDARRSGSGDGHGGDARIRRTEPVEPGVPLLDQAHGQLVGPGVGGHLEVDAVRRRILMEEDPAELGARSVRLDPVGGSPAVAEADGVRRTLASATSDRLVTSTSSGTTEERAADVGGRQVTAVLATEVSTG